MAIEKDIIFSDGSTVRMRASALVPRTYRAHFGRDMVRDMTQLQKSVEAVESGDQDNLKILDLTIFEDVAWVMARHAYEAAHFGQPRSEFDPFPASPDDWLDSFDHALDVYEALPQMMDLWSANTATTSVPVKK